GTQGRAGGENLQTKAEMWPTPSASMVTLGDLEQAWYAGNSGKRPSYKEANQWATPTQRDWKDGACEKADVPTNALLGRQAARWEPFLQDLRNETDGEKSSLSGQTSLPRTRYLTLEEARAMEERGFKRLNPRFVEWLMGWPEGWADAENPLESTSFQHWEMELSRLLLLLRS
ncbi:MAG TPA: hypothetical protein VEG60_25115, partial [Candidatus Binatia bacterium]|nr:hypothetical protein [Candidatus Binatia bacterium]